MAVCAGLWAADGAALAQGTVQGSVEPATQAMPALPPDVLSPSFWIPDFGTVLIDGRTELLVPGLTWHNPATYGHDGSLNAVNWGGGIGRYLDHADGRTDILFGMAFSDSNYNPQLVLGFDRQWRLVGDETLALSIGYAAGITLREDIWNGAPLPFILPVLGVRVLDRVDLYLTYVPPLPTQQLGGNAGNIAFAFMGIRF